MTANAWRLYGYFFAAPPTQFDGADGWARIYSGVTRSDHWPIVSEYFWSKHPDLPRSITDLYGSYSHDRSDYLLLRVARSAPELLAIDEFLRGNATQGYELIAVAVDVNESDPSPSCDVLDVDWLGFEPYPWGEWGLLSVLAYSPSLISLWGERVNEHGLFNSAKDCALYVEDYQRLMGTPGGPEPIAEDTQIYNLRVGRVVNLAAPDT